MQVQRHWEQGSANKTDVRQAWGRDQPGEEHRNTGGKQNTGNTGEQEVESDNKTQEDFRNQKHDSQ